MRKFAKSVGQEVLKRVGRIASRFQEERPLSADLLESEAEYLIVFDTPGATASDVDVRYEDRTVHVQIDRFRDYREGFSMRFPGRGLSLDGVKRLPEGATVDARNARAQLNDDGTLFVFLPKREPGFDSESATVDAGSEKADSPDSGAVDAVDVEPSGENTGQSTGTPDNDEVTTVVRRVEE